MIFLKSSNTWFLWKSWNKTFDGNQLIEPGGKAFPELYSQYTLADTFSLSQECWQTTQSSIMLSSIFILMGQRSSSKYYINLHVSCMCTTQGCKSFLHFLGKTVKVISVSSKKKCCPPPTICSAPCLQSGFQGSQQQNMLSQEKVSWPGCGCGYLGLM